ncbi:MAG: glycoside hydrolase family 43 protein [Oscillospiraceae bacterium]|jgi:alpha-N-arabinofuranosidase|nr:glycoside hydrolase family 43 protein [Oscillospiraceae bacterium]
MHTYENPVIKGFNPDPSVCRAGDEFYLVTSTFEFFPGVPVYRSKNLANWELAGHCLTRRSQLELMGARPSGGVYAPTIRFHNGTFYMTTTNVSHRGNFIVTAADPLGEWSDPVWVDQGGIDPSLFFDDNGSVYFTSTGSSDGRTGIYCCELDPVTLTRVSESVCLTLGSGGRFAEAPHLYKNGKYYYLLLAEGGTEFGHMVTVFRSGSAAGPYQPCPRNPILTHRGADAQSCPLQCAGHADLFSDRYGNWWMAALAVRPLSGVMLHNLGRETCLAPVIWEDGWPVVNDGKPLDIRMSGPLPETPEARNESFYDDFSAPNPEYLFIRNPDGDRYRRDGKTLTLRGNGAALSSLDGEPPVFLGVRQKEFFSAAEAAVSVGDGGIGGIAAYYGPGYFFAVLAERDGGRTSVRTVLRVHGIEAVSAPVSLPDGPATLRIEAGTDAYRLGYVDGGKFIELARGASAGLCTEGTASMTFTGTLFGMFCEKGEAAFRRFRVTVG